MTHAACLLDVYETVLTVGWTRHAEVFERLTGANARELGGALAAWQALVNDGRATVRTALAASLRACGRPADDALLDRLVAEDRRLLREGVTVPGDVHAFLEQLAARGVRTAFVSNCADNTRPMLESLGLADRVDALVLSCEVRAAKPDPLIYETALDRLGVEAGDAVFVDDQPAFCAGAAALGIRAVRIDRGGGTGGVATLAELADLF